MNIFATLMILACVWFSNVGLSEKKNLGFYAGPLSAVAETIAEKVPVPAAEESPQPIEEKTEKTDSEKPEENSLTKG